MPVEVKYPKHGVNDVYTTTGACEKLTVKEELIIRPAKVSGIKKLSNFHLSSCRDDDVTQNMFSARETAIYGLNMIVAVTPVYELLHITCFSALYYDIMVYKSLRNKIMVHIHFGFTAMN